MSEAPARPAIMTHVAIRTSDLDASVDFYRRYAGLHVVHEREDQGIRVVWLSHAREDPEFVIVVLELPHSEMREPAPADHLGFDVESRAEVDRIARLGRESGCLKYGPADAGPIVGYFCMLRDPSGNTCEFSYGQPINPREIGNTR
jgi:catechol 2,3-dioxygenase-like lactoylglutathione lyase family enzyme